MIDKEELFKRANTCCELCGKNDDLEVYKVEPKDKYIVLCKTCRENIDNPTNDINHLEMFK